MCEDYILIYVLKCTATVESLNDTALFTQRLRLAITWSQGIELQPIHLTAATSGSLAVLDRGEISVRNTPSLNIVRSTMKFYLFLSVCDV